MHAIRPILKTFVDLISVANRYIAYAVALLALVFGGIMLWEAVSRHFFDNPTTWAFEISKMTFGFYMIWAGAYTMLAGEHVSMDLFYDKWPPRTQAIMDSLTFVFFLILFLTFLRLIGLDALASLASGEQSNSTLSQPLYQWRTSLVAGVFLLFLQGTATFIKNLWFAVYEEAL